MANAIHAGDENHPDRTDLGHHLGIVTSTAWQSHGLESQLCRGCFDLRLYPRVSHSRGIVLDFDDADFCSRLFGDFLCPLLNFISQACKLFSREVAEFNGMLY